MIVKNRILRGKRADEKVHDVEMYGSGPEVHSQRGILMKRGYIEVEKEVDYASGCKVVYSRLQMEYVTGEDCLAFQEAKNSWKEDNKQSAWFMDLKTPRREKV